jgi:hypothetical protein
MKVKGVPSFLCDGNDLEVLVLVLPDHELGPMIEAHFGLNSVDAFDLTHKGDGPNLALGKGLSPRRLDVLNGQLGLRPLANDEREEVDLELRRQD